MEFSGQYLTYEEYQALGGTLDQTPFNLLEFEARKQIDLNTQRRLVDEKTIPDEVKFCVYHLINKIQSYQKNNNTNKNSETVGSYSVTYKDIEQIIKDKQAEIDDIIQTELFGVIVNNEHILYLGVG